MRRLQNYGKAFLENSLQSFKEKKKNLNITFFITQNNIPKKKRSTSID